MFLLPNFRLFIIFKKLSIMVHYYQIFIKYFFLCLPVLYAILYAPYGYDGYDTGFILGLSWQFFNDYTPYKDIIYVRPPISYIFHSIFFYLGDCAIIINRSFFYIQIATYSFLTIFMLSKAFNYKNSTFIYFLSIVSFMVSAHTFPPMAWHTTDGIFFSIIGIFLILNFQNMVLVILGSFILLLGMLTKQPYYIIPILVFCSIFIQKDLKKLIIFISSFSFFLALFFLYLYHNHAFSQFIIQTTGQTKLRDLLESGFISYTKSFKDLFFVFLPPTFLYLILKIVLPEKIKIEFFYLIIFWILAFMLNIYLSVNTFYSVAHNFSHLLFIASVIYVLIKLIPLKENRYILVLLFLSISWASSISWGYNLTIFFMAPMLFILAIPILANFENKLSIVKVNLTVIFAFATYYIGYQHPYSLDHPNTKKEMTYHLGDIFTKFKYIYVDKKTYEEYRELKELTNQYKDNFVVLPASTLIHFITNTNNPIGVDWVMNAEINTEKNNIIKKLENKDIAVILKKSNLNPDGKFGSEVTNYIYSNWEITQRGDIFDVYKFKK